MSNRLFRSLVRRVQAKKIIEWTLGNDAYRGIRAQGIRLESSLRGLRNQYLQRISNKDFLAPSDNVLTRRGLAKLGKTQSAYSTVVSSDVLLRHISKIQEAKEFAGASVIAVLEPKTIKHSTLQLGLNTSCQIEFWNMSDTEVIHAPRENRASMSLSRNDFHLVPTTVAGVPAMVPSVLTKRMLDDVMFPVDAV